MSTATGASKLKESLIENRPKIMRVSPPYGPDSPIQNFNQCTEEQRQSRIAKKDRAHRIQRHVRQLYPWFSEGRLVRGRD